jgi:hypothetical protein
MFPILVCAALVAFLALGAGAVAFVALVAGIRRADRQMSLGNPACGRADAFARKMTGAYAGRQPRSMRGKAPRRSARKELNSSCADSR